MTPNPIPTHRSAVELEAHLEVLRAAPTDQAHVDLIVARPAKGQRLILDSADLDPVVGFVGDTWADRGSSRTPDGSAHPDMQVTVMGSRIVAFIAVDPDRRALAGDQLYVDLDLSHDNLPSGSQLWFGPDPDAPAAILEVTDEPHTGCAQFIERFGEPAMRFVNGRIGRAMRLRGLNARVLQGGRVRRGDPVRVHRPAPRE